MDGAAAINTSVNMVAAVYVDQLLNSKGRPVSFKEESSAVDVTCRYCLVEVLPNSRINVFRSSAELELAKRL